MRLFKFIIMPVLCCVSLLCNAAGNSNKIQPLDSLMLQLKNADGYAYDITVLSWLPDKKHPDTTLMTNYQSRKDIVLYAASGKDLFFLCSHGQFRIDDAGKVIYFHPIKDTAELAALQHDWQDPGQLGLLDSFFLKNARVAEQKNKAGKTKYVLKYPADMLLQQATFSYDQAKRFFTAISYTMVRPLNVPGRADLKANQQVTMNNYRQHPPPLVPLLLAQGDHLQDYLQQHYKNYSLRIF